MKKGLKKKNNFSVWIISIILLLVVAGFLINNYSKKEILSSPANLITKLNPSSYKIVDSLKVEDKYYIDKNFIIKSLPSFLKDCNAIKTSKSNRKQVSFYVNKPVKVYLAWDMRKKIPSGWTKTSDKVYVSDKDASKGSYLQLLYRNFNAEKVIVPKKNLKSNYIIFVCPNSPDLDSVIFTNIDTTKEITITEDKFKVEWVNQKDVRFYLLSIIKIDEQGKKIKDIYTSSFSKSTGSYEIDFTKEPFLSEGNGRYKFGLTAVMSDKNDYFNFIFVKS